MTFSLLIYRARTLGEVCQNGAVEDHRQRNKHLGTSWLGRGVQSNVPFNFFVTISCHLCICMLRQGNLRRESFPGLAGEADKEKRKSFSLFFQVQ